MGIPVEAPEPLPPPPRRSLAGALIALAAVVFLVALAGLVSGSEPFASWFFVFAWWSWIFALDGLVYLRRGSSILFDRTRGFVLLVPWSTAFWLVFELCNLRLENWYYVGLPASAISRYAGIFVSFATVLLGIFETAELLSTFGVGERLRVNPERWRVTDSRRRWMTFTGLAFLILPLLFPRYCYPLIWGATFFLLEPWLVKQGEPSVWAQLAAGRPGGPLRIFLAGAICGLCWESWNFWASAKWIYTVPFFDELKLFEMPLLGFLGFPPFALECYTFARFLVAKRVVPEWEPGRTRRCVNRRRQGRWALGAALFSLPAIFAVDRWLVRSTAMELEDYVSLGAEERAALRTIGVRSAADLGAALRSWQHEELLDPKSFDSLTRERRLADTALMGARGVRWLSSVGVDSVEKLARRDARELEHELVRSGAGPAPQPGAPEVRVWCRKARGASD